MTSEELTAKRRAERKQFKLDRARAIAAVAEEAELIFAIEGRVIKPALSGPAIPSAATWKPAPESMPEPPVTPANEEEGDPVDEEPLEDVERLQLTLQEAFFLLWNLDCLSVLDPHTVCAVHSLCGLDTNVFEANSHEPPKYLDHIPKGSYTSGSEPTFAIRQSVPHQLRRLSSLPLSRMGRQGRHKVLC
jgi:hypothetical protein